MGLKVDESYDNELKEIEFYKNSRIHQLMLPYIGFNYQEHRVLLVAESHYLGNEEDRKKVANFKKWYEDKGDITLSQEGHINTREVVEQWFSNGNGLFQKIKNTKVEAYEYSFDENGTKLYAVSYFIILKENLLIANFYSISEKEIEKMLEYFYSIKKIN